MNRDPFLRLALIALSSVWVTGAFVVGRFLGLLAALGYVFAVFFAGALTVVWEHEQTTPVEDLRQRRRQPAEGTRGFERIE